MKMKMTTFAKLADLLYLACSGFVLVAAFGMVNDGYTVDAIACFVAVIVNAVFVLAMGGARRAA